MGNGIKGFTDTFFWCISPVFDWVFSNRVLFTRLKPYRLRHCRAFVFCRRQRKNPSHPLCESAATQIDLKSRFEREV
jgi:hypothetical protein